MTNLRDLAATEMSTLLAGELDRRDSEWEAAVTILADKLAVASTAETAAAAEQTRQELQPEIDRLQALVARLQAELAAQKATNAKLGAALQTVQRAISFTDPDDPTSGPGLPPGTHHGDNDDSTGSDLGDRPERSEAAWNRTATEATATASTPAPVNRSLKLVGTTHASPAGSPSDLVEYVTQMLDEIERIYWSDSGSDLTPAELLDRLTANLNYARDAFLRRAGSTPAGISLLEQHVTTLLETKAETSFGRHLGFAAYDLFHPKNSQNPQLRSEAS
jgi:hypothetical protein